ncbi:MAG: SpoIIE family protein phosphatase [Planctomycetes bacterium]|nr:SpoIIE family protein phosphatase [Planctomycetota bacterium]
MAILQVVKGLNPGQQFPLEASRSILGRHPDCDIVLDVGAVSRQHAQITQVGAGFYVEDLNSRNGTWVNGEQVQGRRLLRENDRLKICDILFTFHHGQPSKQRDDEPTADDDSSAVTVLDDDANGGSTIMSTINLGSSTSGVRMRVNPEVKLRAMIDIAHSLGKALALDEVLSNILDSLFKIFVQADRGFVLLRSASGALVPRAVKHRREDGNDTIRISRTIVNQVMNSKEAVLSADAASDARFEMSQSVADFRIRSMMCAPLVDTEGEAIGILQVDTLDQRSRFQQEDLDVLASVANQVAIAVQNAQLHEASLRQKQIERDLQIAHNVQQRLLPSAAPQVAGYGFFDFYEPANLIGGDYYDYIELPGNRLGIVLADVSGKGISAALLVAKLSADIRYCLVSESQPERAMARLNNSFIRGGWEDRFVTMVLAVLDIGSHEVTLANAGHMPPLLRRDDGQVEALGEEESGLPIGVDSDSQYQQSTFRLKPNDWLTVFTDGISEAMNPQREIYGLERLHKQLRSPAENVVGQGRGVLADVKRFVGKYPQSDDMCLICFGRMDE